MTVREDPLGGVWVQNGPTEVYLGTAALEELAGYLRSKYPTQTDAVLDALKKLTERDWESLPTRELVQALSRGEVGEDRKKILAILDARGQS
jgi:hypothetical protein